MDEESRRESPDAALSTATVDETGTAAELEFCGLLSARGGESSEEVGHGRGHTCNRNCEHRRGWLIVGTRVARKSPVESTGNKFHPGGVSRLSTLIRRPCWRNPRKSCGESGSLSMPELSRRVPAHQNRQARQRVHQGMSRESGGEIRVLRRAE